MIFRQISSKIVELCKVYPAITLTGPRQSGKTTLVKSLFEDYAYVNLENPDIREAAEEDPRRFLSRYKDKGVVIDEAQRVPELFSYLQQILDESGKMGKFILTGSQNFLLFEKITQSLAGRVAIFHLFPFTQSELEDTDNLAGDIDLALFKGGYPVIYDRSLAPTDYFPSYIQTYVERDVRTISNIENLGLFQRFLRLCAGRTGQLFNASSVGNDLGVSYKTVQSWLSILETSFIVFRLAPHFANFRKRIVKQPKLFFYDTGLLCSLLGISTEDQLNSHYMRGNIFESYIISEYVKNQAHLVKPNNCFFWRDSQGHEIDLLLEFAREFKAIEIKSGQTISNSFFSGLRYFKELSGGSDKSSFLVYGGEEETKRTHGKVVSWNQLTKLLRELGH
ncbi:MAG: ATP-binding protein [Deltaproteobacteria bacterium]|nr:ATP-binding protein [Deltaproteobacteria bacterium]